MDLEFKYLAQPSQCVYLPDKQWQLEYAFSGSLSAREYGRLIDQRWRRFGFVLFRPSCPSCNACIPIRVVAGRYQPTRSQRRVIKANEGILRMESLAPSITEKKLDLYMRHHNAHAANKGWPEPSEQGAIEHINAIMEGPLPVEEWCFYLEDELLGVSYVDLLPDGFSGIYFYYDPDYRERSLGTWMIISMIRRAARLALPYAYLGYFIKGCRSMEYKGKFAPSEVLSQSCQWIPFDGNS